MDHEEKKVHQTITQLPYTMAVPKGWNCIADKSQLPSKVDLIYIGTGNGTFKPTINVATEPTNMSLEDYVNLAKKYHESIHGTTCRLLGPVNTSEGEACLLQVDSPSQWGNVRFLQAALVKDSQAYVITATSLQKEFGNFYASFLQSIQSFNINSALLIDKEKK